MDTRVGAVLWPLILLPLMWKWCTRWLNTPSRNSSKRAPSNAPSNAASSYWSSRPGGDSVQPGTIVIYQADPLMYGRMVILGPNAAGLLECESLHERSPDGTYRRDLFHPQELTVDEDQARPQTTQTGLPGPA
jgi:hypothetical protein